MLTRGPSGGGAAERVHPLGPPHSRAAARYLDELDAESVTRQIDLAVAALAGEDDSAADAVAVAVASPWRDYGRLVIERGGIYWADLGAPQGSRPAKRRPVVVISAQTYNRSRLAAVMALVVNSNTELAAMPGNVFLPAAATGLPRDSVVNVTAVVTFNKTGLAEQAGLTPLALLREIDRGLRSSLDL